MDGWIGEWKKIATTAQNYLEDDQQIPVILTLFVIYYRLYLELGEWGVCEYENVYILTLYRINPCHGNFFLWFSQFWIC